MNEETKPNAGQFSVNNQPTTKNPYPFLPRKVAGGAMAVFNPNTMEPLCFIPDHLTAWAGQFYVAFTVRKLVKDGMTIPQVRREAERLARAYNTAHLRDRVYIKTIKGAVRKAIDHEKRGWNSWATDYEVQEQGGRRIMVRFLADPTK